MGPARAAVRALRQHPAAWRRCLRALPQGPALGPVLEQLLHLCAGGPIWEGELIVGARFNLALDGGVVSWTWSVLLRLWQALGALPDSAVVENQALVRLVRTTGEGAGSYHHLQTQSPLGPASATIGVRRLHGPSSHVAPIDRFSATVHHEVGHAVAVRLGLYGTLYEEVPGSPWVFQGDLGAFLARLLPGAEPLLLRLGALYLSQPAGRGRSLGRAVEQLRRQGEPVSRALLRDPLLRHLVHSSRHAIPAYHDLPRAADGLVYFYDSGYRRGYVCLHDRIATTRVSAYQFRSPNEWFAEIYAVHHAGVEAGGRPGAVLAGISPQLRRIAAWLRRQEGG